MKIPETPPNSKFFSLTEWNGKDVDSDPETAWGFIVPGHEEYGQRLDAIKLGDPLRFVVAAVAIEEWNTVYEHEKKSGHKSYGTFTRNGCKKYSWTIIDEWRKWGAM